MASTKRRDIAAVLRARIRDGVHPPGSRIPPQRMLLREFAVSPVTLQRTVDRLGEQGFLVARGSAGTFVAAHPPDRSLCALVLPAADDGKPLNRFWSTLRDAALAWDAGDGTRFTVHLIRPGDDEHRRLCGLAVDGAIAGILFATTPYQFIGTPLLTAPLPRIAVGDDPPRADAEALSASFIHLQDEGLQEQLFAGFHAAGRRQVAVITDQRFAGAMVPDMAVARKAGLETRPQWWLGLPNIAEAEDTARAVARLLCSAGAHDRPDCLVITDDNLVPAATAGILDAGLRVPQDLLVAAHANFPQPVPAAVPCRRYGYDARQVLATAWAEIAHRRAGHPRRSVAVPLTFSG